MSAISFINNFSTKLTSAITSFASQMTLDSVGTTPNSLSHAVAFGRRVFLTLANAAETEFEVVRVISVSGNVCDIERSSEFQTTPKAWPAGTAVEMRLPANVLDEIYRYGGGSGGQVLTWLNGQGGEAAKPVWANSTSLVSGSNIFGGLGAEINPNTYHSVALGYRVGYRYNDDGVDVTSAVNGYGLVLLGAYAGARSPITNWDGGHIGIGFYSLYESSGYRTSSSEPEDLRTCLGAYSGSYSTGRNTTGFGARALEGNTYANAVGLGPATAVSGDDQVQIGNSSSTTYVYGTVQNRSDLRDKADVRDTVLGLEFIEALRPVDYRWDMRESYRQELPKRPEEPPKAPDPLPEGATKREQAAHAKAMAKHAKTLADHEEAMAAFNQEMARVLEANKLANIVRDGSKKRSRYHHGLIAQEVKDTINELGVDFGGFQDHSVAGGDDVLSIGYDELVAPLIKAVQELSARVKALEAERNS